MLDPWSAGGVYVKNTQLQVDNILMPACAHHLDLRSPNPNDPPYVVSGRTKIYEYIQLWLNQKPKSQKKNIN